MTTHFPNLANGAETAPAAPVTGSAPPVPPQRPTIATLPPSLPPSGWQFAHLIRTPGDPIVHQRFEFTGLARRVRDHLANQIGERTRDEAARLMFVQGRPGDGKSTGCLVACLKAGFHVIVLSPGMFAGAEEGKPIELLHAIMEELARWSAVHRCRVVVIIDDFDLSIANVGKNTAHTIHSQLVVNEFMSLADKRHLYRNVDGSNIGFILTANNATGLRESLTRSGRALVYDHSPSVEDKTNIAFAILDPKTSAERALVQKLVDRFAKRQPVSFWMAAYLEMRAIQSRRLTGHGMPDKSAIDRMHGQRMALVPEIAWEAAKTVRQSRIRDRLAKAKWWRR